MYIYNHIIIYTTLYIQHYFTYIFTYIYNNIQPQSIGGISPYPASPQSCRGARDFHGCLLSDGAAQLLCSRTPPAARTHGGAELVEFWHGGNWDFGHQKLIGGDWNNQLRFFELMFLNAGYIRMGFYMMTGWWWLEHGFYFSIQLGMSSSQLTNSHIFQRGRYTTNQKMMHFMGYGW